MRILCTKLLLQLVLLLRKWMSSSKNVIFARKFIRHSILNALKDKERK